MTAQAENYGLAPTCRSELVFYIARNTELRYVSGTVQFIATNGDASAARDFVAELTGPVTGLLQAGMDLPGRTGSCASLELVLEITACQDASQRHMECPAIRVSPEPVFRELDVWGEALDICAD